MRNLSDNILVIIIALFLFAIVLGVTGLIWWGVGSLVVFAFGINFTWTYLHGLAIAVLSWALKGVLKITVKKED